jgi:hypothetical protein
MRQFFGMIVGCALTILIVYMHDSAIGSSTTGEPAQGTRQIVNWDVAAGEWSRMQHNARMAWDKLTANVERAGT